MRLTEALLVSLALLYSNPSFSNDEYGRAADFAQRAILQTEYGKKTSKRAEKQGKEILNNYLGLEEKDLVYFIWAVPMIQGGVSTRPLKNFSIRGDGWYIKPELDYRFTGEYSTQLNISWDL